MNDVTRIMTGEGLPSGLRALLRVIAEKDAEIKRLRAELAAAPDRPDYKADYERSVLNGDRLFDEVERLRAALAAYGEGGD